MSFFLDSGAFSALSQSCVIDVYEYIEFIKENNQAIDFYACLDVINNAEKTYENQKIMEKEGLSPLPVFHFGSDIKWIKKYIKEGYSYICLGGMVPISTRELLKWLDKLFSNYLVDPKGSPIIKIHGFGLSSLKLIKRYPWYSVDSTSWASTSRMGAIIIPRFVRGRWLYDEFSWTVGVSRRSPYINERTKHYNNLPPKLQEIVDLYLESKGYKIGSSELIKVSPDYKLKQNKELWYKKREVIERIKETGVSNNHKLRNEINILFFIDLANSLPEWPWFFLKKKKKKGFLS